MEPFQIGDAVVRGRPIIHPGPTVGYRIEDASGSVAYLPDHEPALGVRAFPATPEWTSGFDLAAEADLLIHDAQYTTAEYRSRIGWGHSAMRDALTFATLVGVRRFVSFHHDPTHDDATLDCIDAAARAAGELRFALIPGTEGSTFDL